MVFGDKSFRFEQDLMLKAELLLDPSGTGEAKNC